MKLKEMFAKVKNLPSVKIRQLPIFQNAYYWFIAPLAIVFIALICGLIYNTSGNAYNSFMNVGIDFTGGTVLTVEVNAPSFNSSDYAANLDIIDGILQEKGLKLSTDQTGGSNTIIVRYDNVVTVDGVAVDYGSNAEKMNTINEELKSEITSAFSEKYGEATAIEVGAEMTDATASNTLVKKAFLSVGIAMLLMLVYIVIRFDLFSGIAAVCAQLHDIIILLSLVIIFRIQVNSTFIAAVITVVAYAINNTIVIFDRVRENIAPFKAKKTKIDPRSIVNGSVTDSLRRTLFSSITTLLTIVVLACCGVQSLTEFALPIIFGILAGLYSSNFIAPSIWGLMMDAKINGTRRAQKKKRASYSK